MNGLVKVIASVIIVMTVAAGTALWLNWGQSRNKQAAQQEVIPPTVEPEIPKPLEQIALEEYAIEFEGEPRITVDVELCNIVKDQCRAQGIKDCEDYEMCVTGISQ